MPKLQASPKKKSAARAKRIRRSSEEIINLVIEAATDEFERNGYEKAKTAEIARKAGVAETLIFSNFGSKAKLFHDSIFTPLDQLLHQFSADNPIKASNAQDLKAGTQAYVDEFQSFIRHHSRMFKSLIAAQMFETDTVKGMHHVEGLHAYFSQSSAMMDSRKVGKPNIDPQLLTRISFATSLACILFKDWLFPKGLASEADISAAISSFVAEGLNPDAKIIYVRDNTAVSQKSSRKKTTRRVGKTAK